MYKVKTPGHSSVAPPVYPSSKAGVRPRCLCVCMNICEVYEHICVECTSICAVHKHMHVSVRAHVYGVCEHMWDCMSTYAEYMSTCVRDSCMLCSCG